MTAYAENLKKIESERSKSKSDFFKEETTTLPKVIKMITLLDP